MCGLDGLDDGRRKRQVMGTRGRREGGYGAVVMAAGEACDKRGRKRTDQANPHKKDERGRNRGHGRFREKRGDGERRLDIYRYGRREAALWQPVTSA